MSWYLTLPWLLAGFLLPFLSFFFFCRFCGSPFRWKNGICYALLSAALQAGEAACALKGSPGLLAEILLLTCCGRMLLHRNWTESLSLSVLILSVLTIPDGIASWIGYRIWLPWLLRHPRFVYPSDTMRELMKLLFVCGLFAWILRHFHRSIRHANRQTLFWLSLPVFFTALVVRIIRTSLYGDEVRTGPTGEILMIWKGSHIELLFLQFFACACLFAALSAYQKIQDILLTEQKVLLLEQQTRTQETYLQEALLRERRTRGLRHDMKNHLTVLTELLRTGQTGQAYDYLTRLEETAASLSPPVQTGCAAADALLGNKLAAANQEHIQVQCELYLPKDSAVRDLDWCILLANGLDNAINACKAVPEDARRIRISSRRQGSFYLLLIENSCDRTLREVPADGIGLTNIRTVMDAYHGTAETTVSDGCYRLRLLFGSLQQRKDVLHPASISSDRSDDIDREPGQQDPGHS